MSEYVAPERFTPIGVILIDQQQTGEVFIDRAAQPPELQVVGRGRLLAALHIQPIAASAYERLINPDSKSIAAAAVQLAIESCMVDESVLVECIRPTERVSNHVFPLLLDDIEHTATIDRIAHLQGFAGVDEWAASWAYAKAVLPEAIKPGESISCHVARFANRI